MQVLLNTLTNNNRLKYLKLGQFLNHELGVPVMYPIKNQADLPDIKFCGVTSLLINPLKGRVLPMNRAYQYALK